MDKVEEALISHLLTCAPLVNLIGDRIKPFHIPPKELLPCLTLFRVDTPRIVTHQSAGASSDLIKPRIQCDAWANTQLETKEITQLVQEELHGKRGEIGVAPNRIVVGFILQESSNPLNDLASGMFRWMSQYILATKE